MPIPFPSGSSLAYSIWNKCNGNNDLVLLVTLPQFFDRLKVLLRSPVEQALRFELAQISVNYPNSSLSFQTPQLSCFAASLKSAALRQKYKTKKNHTANQFEHFSFLDCIFHLKVWNSFHIFIARLVPSTIMLL